MDFYIAGCLYTARHPDMSLKILKYVATRHDISLVRCCVPGWKKQFYEETISDGEIGALWNELPQSHVFSGDDRIWSLCPNCMNIIEEWRGVSEVHSLWELIDNDKDFRLPDHTGLVATVQDCWRMRDRTATHDAVRSLLRKMNVKIVEINENRENSDFCGMTLYRQELERNLKLAPRHYCDNTEGLFLPHSDEEQIRIMREHCARYETETVVCYCHYCLEGLVAGGVNGLHIAELVFDK